jgi:two-component system cell cycle sensor histidine kinase PleC
MRFGRSSKALLPTKGRPRDRVAAGLRCLILVTVFAMARLQATPHSRLFDIVVVVGAIYVVVSSFLPLSRYDPRRSTMAMLAIDIMLITMLIYADSGIYSDYYLLYFLPILHASLRLNFRDAVGTSVLSAMSYLLIGLLEGTGSTVTTSVISRVLTFTLSASLMAGFFIMLSREQRAYQQLNKHYEDAIQAKTEFLSKVSHEFRTPLTAIVGFSQLLYEHKDELDPTRQQEYLVIVREQSQHLARMIEDMLDLSRIDEGRLVLKRDAVHLADTVDAALMLLDHPEDRERVEVSVEPKTRTVWADRNEMEQVMARLLHTALTLPDNSAPMRVQIGPAVEEDWVQVGLHISRLDEWDEALAPLTDSAETAAVRRSNGKCLGLAVARALVELHGGRIWVEEGYDTGIAITFALPACQPKDTGPEVIVGVTSGSDSAGAEANGEDHDRGRRPVRAKAHAGQPGSIG